LIDWKCREPVQKAGEAGRDEIVVNAIPTLFQSCRRPNSILFRNGRDIIFGTETKERKTVPTEALGRGINWSNGGIGREKPGCFEWAVIGV